MGILKRIKNIVVADVHETLDKLENPVSMLKQYLVKQKSKLRKLKSTLSPILFRK